MAGTRRDTPAAGRPAAARGIPPVACAVMRCAAKVMLQALIAWTVLVAVGARAESLPDPAPDAARAYLVEIDDALVWSHAASTPLPTASLTKMMTALLVLEAWRPEEIVTANAAVVAATGSRLGLRVGDRMRLSDLLAGAVIASANDACLALAIWRDGTEAKFVARMNERAAALGLRDTHFTNACGHHAPDHVSTAADLAVLAHAVMAQPVYRDLARRIDADLATVDGRRRFHIANRNALIGRYVGAIGVKSGYTPQAGPCIVAWAVRGEHHVLVVMLGARNRWWDAHALLDRAFAQVDGR